ncbi:hypothetical protein VNO80_24238 [Phaseolus coccineus]|uniref:Uncharacterized protein n=1 Tax=Phaseolus coccineus TaxID=3886 RepID=A0AAN9QMW1_PHACN
MLGNVQILLLTVHDICVSLSAWFSPPDPDVLWMLDYIVSLFVGYKHCELVICYFFSTSLVKATYSD